MISVEKQKIRKEKKKKKKREWKRKKRKMIRKFKRKRTEFEQSSILETIIKFCRQKRWLLLLLYTPLWLVFFSFAFFFLLRKREDMEEKIYQKGQRVLLLLLRNIFCYIYFTPSLFAGLNLPPSFPFFGNRWG